MSHNTEETKQCKKCEVVKPHWAFSRREASADGLRSWCKECLRAYECKRRGRPAPERPIVAPTLKWCPTCKEAKMRSEFSYYKQGVFGLCKLCERAAGRASHATLRFKVLAHYSNGFLRCACCSESTYEFLTIDHINNDGASHRRKIGGGGTHLYQWLVKHNFPKGFQVLCCNCQRGKVAGNGVCVHQFAPRAAA